ncbi:MAG: diguanylate cyclase [Methylotenera sp. RIFCSPLOWO2_02_FULL_45_14]|nr:MAG: diguanylate cyclase [Methylotenera sp. RIFCSPLOWO2_02_FULL_45_14]
MKQFFRNRLSNLDLIVLRIVGIYFIFGLLWIFITNATLIKLVSNHEQFTLFITYKGVAYIFITSALLYLLFRKTLQRQNQIETSLQLSEERWKFALEGSGDGVWDWNLETDHVFRSARWQEIYGYSENEIDPTSRAGRALTHPDDMHSIVDDVKAYLEGKTDIYVSEFRLRCKDGSWKWTLSRGMVVSRSKEGKPLRMIGTHTDITARKRSEAQVIRLAHYDLTTNLPNRMLFLDRFKQEIVKAHRTSQTITLMYLDLDRFKEVNDTLGHDIGDLLLKETAQRLESCVREMDTVARLGGDEFTLILCNLDNQSSIERIAQEILDKLAKPFQLGNELIYITTSIGISIYPEDGNNVEVLLKNADQAMYAAKQHGRNRYHYFTPSMQEAALMRMHLISDLRIALNANQFRVFYQPIVELATGNIYKAEALIRWQHPTRGLVSPAEFIPAAEETGLIIEIGDWVFSEAANQVAKWRSHHPGFQISVNKSPVQFRSNSKNHINWIDHLISLGLTGPSIAVEITEGLLLDARDSVINQLNALRAAGVQIAIDDFGTGYSSLAYLKKFDIDYVKIDQSFTSNIRTGSSDMVLCEAIIVMAHKLGMKVIAEGIETKEQLDLLVIAGCDYGQGYWFSKPVPADEFEKLLYRN